MSHPARFVSGIPWHFVYLPIPLPFAMAKRILQAGLLLCGAFTAVDVTASELELFTSVYLIPPYSLPHLLTQKGPRVKQQSYSGLEEFNLGAKK